MADIDRRNNLPRREAGIVAVVGIVAAAGIAAVGGTAVAVGIRLVGGGGGGGEVGGRTGLEAAARIGLVVGRRVAGDMARDSLAAAGVGKILVVAAAADIAG